jgi:hypothetical protein
LSSAGIDLVLSALFTAACCETATDNRHITVDVLPWWYLAVDCHGLRLFTRSAGICYAAARAAARCRCFAVMRRSPLNCTARAYDCRMVPLAGHLIATARSHALVTV